MFECVARVCKRQSRASFARGVLEDMELDRIEMRVETYQGIDFSDEGRVIGNGLRFGRIVERSVCDECVGRCGRGW
jgi:hypothetical protein